MAATRTGWSDATLSAASRRTLFLAYLVDTNVVTVGVIFVITSINSSSRRRRRRHGHRRRHAFLFCGDGYAT